AFDFKTEGAADVDRTWESEPAGRWMTENAWRYGFVMSYPRGREDETCYGYEPWHYRYFGRPLAAEIHASGETTREYLWIHRTGACAVGPGDTEARGTSRRARMPCRGAGGI